MPDSGHPVANLPVKYFQPNIQFLQPNIPLPANTPSGAYVAPRDLNIKLNQTQGKSFELSGEVWLNGPSLSARYPGDAPAGFALFLREMDGLHRYEANSDLLRAKRRSLGGSLLTNITPVARMPDYPLHQWISFTLLANQDRIVFIFGGHEAEIRGPLDTDGANEVSLVAGSMLRNIQLKVLDDAKNSADGNT